MSELTIAQALIMGRGLPLDKPFNRERVEKVSASEPFSPDSEEVGYDEEHQLVDAVIAGIGIGPDIPG